MVTRPQRGDRCAWALAGLVAVLGLACTSGAVLAAGSGAGPGAGLQAVADAHAEPMVNTHLPTATLAIRGQRLVTEVAATPSQREIGLMNRFSLQPDHGMLFVFDAAQPLAFWMKNTFIPLSVAFVDAGGRILNVESMAPQDLATHWSQGPALYAIEMRQGWFLDHGIGAGDRVDGLPHRTPPR
ncbi:MAG: DUF192 domain-containing protein [Proteobacteria bacterium]|jgi:uncharacterized membrane protein (UPF0127 family)|nr:DUF192 domain-containing protein [Pseudomonadota bacterium]